MRLSVQIEVPDRVARVIDDIAREKGETLRTIAVAAVRKELVRWAEQAQKSPKIINQAIGELVRLGVDDGRIATTLGVTRARVADRRRRLGLAPNKRKKKS